MSLPQDFIDIYPKLSVEQESGPIYYLWLYCPNRGTVYIEHNEGRHSAEHLDHSHMAEKSTHPEKIHGFIYRIKNGWRITDWEHKPITDPYISKQIKQSINKLQGELK
jgi:hypothetical protein